MLLTERISSVMLFLGRLSEIIQKLDENICYSQTEYMRQTGILTTEYIPVVLLIDRINGTGIMTCLIHFSVTQRQIRGETY